MTLKLIVDTDAGVDDAQALMLALAHPGVEVAAITCVTGNVHVDQVVANVSVVADVMGSPAPIYRGCDRPLIASWRPEDDFVHGKDGLGDWDERPPIFRLAEAEHAVTALLRLANSAPGEYTLVTLGPLTNLAIALMLDPDLPSKLKALYVMGGAYTATGNTVNVTAEWNLFCDPEAGKIVCDAFPFFTLVTWETTIYNPLPWPDYHALCAMPTPRAQFFKGITYKTRSFAEKIPGLNGYPIPDPLTMAVALDPGLIRQAGTYPMTVETGGTHTRGQTVIDHLRRWGRADNVRVVTQIDLDGVVKLYR
ncbi:MAG: nucleoside hydrolase, partial [Anaerolinea sp.]|nr:nucleoside hydrolase [Anaerolinea sp.]